MQRAAPAVDKLTDALGRIVRQVAIPRFLEHVAERAGTTLDRSAYFLLVLLAERPRRVGELAEALTLDMSTVSRQVDALEEAGLAHRERPPADRRASLVVIDDTGRAAVEAHRRARRAFFAELLDDVPPEDLEHVAEVLTRLAERMEELASS